MRVWIAFVVAAIIAAGLIGCSREERPEDGEVLRQIGEACKAYAIAHKGWWPSVTGRPEACLPDFGDFAVDSNLLARLTDGQKPRVCYLGYAAESEETAEPVLDVLDRGEELGKEIELNPSPPHSGELVSPLKEGAERFYIRDIGNPGASAYTQHLLPVLWELPAEDSDGGWVLFMDGSVSWFPYPGPFPMTRGLVERCRRVTSTGPSQPVKSSEVQKCAAEAALLLDTSAGYPNLYGFRQWSVASCDESPSAEVGDRRGYRIRLCQYLHGFENEPFEDARYVQIVLLPAQKVEDPLPRAGSAPWEILPAGRPTREAYLGEKDGYHWFAYGLWTHLDDLQQGLELKGGDDPVEPLLSHYHPASYESYDLTRRIVRAGGADAAFQVLDRELEKTSGPNRANLIHTLGIVPGQKSVDLLKRLYESDDQHDSSVAAEVLGLGAKPVTSKTECLKVFGQSGESYNDAAAAVSGAATMKWPETLPYLERLLSQQSSARSYRLVWCAKRAVEGKPVPEELAKAFEVLRHMRLPWDRTAVTDEEISRAKDTILRTDDPEAATILALEYAVTNRETFYLCLPDNTPEVRALAMGILQALPRDVVLRTLDSLPTFNRRGYGEVEQVRWDVKRLIEQEAPGSK